MTSEKKYFALNDLDKKLEKYLDFENGYFIEIGANDGVTQSNTLHLEIYKRWNGLLVEPSQVNFFKCRASRSPKNSIFCAACVPFEYSERFVPMIYSNLMSVSELPGVDIGEVSAHAERGRQFLQPYEDIFHFGAEAKTLQTLLDAANAPKLIDFFSLDVEGAEMHVLRGVNHSDYRFRFLLVENRSFDALKSYLSEQGYAFIDALSEHDYLFVNAR